jgi:prolycopene isomerase
LGGLSAGAFLSKAGKKVLVVERLDGPGGYAHAFRRGPYIFDPAIHAIGECGPGGEVDTWLSALGVRDQVKMLPMDPFYTVILPDSIFTAPTGLEPYTEALVERFPDEADGIRGFMGQCVQLKRTYHNIRHGGSWENLGQAGGLDLSTMMEYRKKSAADVMDEYFKDPRLKSTVSGIWPIEGVPPSKLSFVSFGGMLMSLLEHGLNYCEGSFQNLANALVMALTSNGGELVLGHTVNRIMVDGEQVVGVRLEDGLDVRAPVVVSNADATQTFEKLVEPEHLPESYLRRLRGMSLSPSAYLIYMATSMDLRRFGYAEEIFKYTSVDFDEAWQRMQNGEVSVLGLAVPSLVDPSLAPPDEYTLTALAVMPFDIGMPWSKAKERYTEAILQQIEAVFPGIRDHITFIEAATPLALEQYSWNRCGAMYGWENSPGQTGARRPANKTPLEGLYLASAWSRPGSGSINAIFAGFQTAQMILAYADRNEFLRSLRSNVA